MALKETTPEILAAGVAEHPDKVALLVDGDAVSYAELADRVAAAESYLVTRQRVRPGQKISTFMANSVDAAVWFLAAGGTGCTLVPLNTKLRPEELAHQLRASDSTLVVVRDAELLDLLEDAVLQDGSIREDLPELKAVVTCGAADAAWANPYEPTDERFEVMRPVPDDVLLMQFTSGTTALPKGVLLTHRQILLNARGVAGRLGVTPEDTVCSPSPFFHCAGSTLTLVLGLASGTTVVTTGAFHPGRTIDVIEQEQITVYSGVEAFFVALMNDSGFGPERVASIRTGWMAAPKEIAEQVHERMGLTGIVNVYGLSEASPNVSIADPSGNETQRRTCGKPHSGTQVRIVDPGTRAVLPDGKIGVIEVRGPCVTHGYYRNEEATREAIDRDGWLHSGDLGFIDSNGDLNYDGRSKDMLRVGGENVAPAEIEAALLTHPDVLDAAVIGAPHPRLLEVPVAFVVAREGTDPDPAALSAYAAERLAGFKVPHKVVVVEALPKTGSGKTQKVRLKELLRT